MAHAQKPDFVFRRNGRVHLNRRGRGGASVQSTTGSRGVRISGSNAGYTMFRSSVKSTGYPLQFVSFPFTSLRVRHRVPSHFSWTPLLWSSNQPNAEIPTGHHTTSMPLGDSNPQPQQASSRRPTP